MVMLNSVKSLKNLILQTMKNKDFAVFILTHGRPDNVITYNTLKKAGYTGDIYIVIDNEDKLKELIKKIGFSNIEKEEKEFLIKAAYRHTVFNYQSIADFYAHSNKEVQELMEDSALVIIDFNKAIENGYVKLSKELEKSYTSDYEK